MRPTLKSVWMVRAIGASMCVAAILAFNTRASAAAFVIDDRFDDPSPIGVFANDWEGGLFINGAIFQQGLNNPASGSVNGESLTFDGSWIDLGQSVPLNRTVYFVEPGTPNVVSDILQYSISTDGSFGHLVGSFVSDDDNGNLGQVPPGTLPENIWLEGSGDFNYGAPFMGASVLTTPEPMSLLTLLVAGVALRRRRG